MSSRARRYVLRRCSCEARKSPKAGTAHVPPAASPSGTKRTRQTRGRPGPSASSAQAVSGSTAADTESSPVPVPFGSSDDPSGSDSMAREEGARTPPHSTAAGSWKLGAQYAPSLQACKLPTATAAMRPSKRRLSSSELLSSVGYSRFALWATRAVLASTASKCRATSAIGSRRQSRVSSWKFRTDTTSPPGFSPTTTGNAGSR
mmetsp:Transcript_127647/g.272173  ORF Transcript_127647/g.272173 Transcript_127647/m.272173 type:complete len:204 (-) Transcript_127647:56-667(-)